MLALARLCYYSSVCVFRRFLHIGPGSNTPLICGTDVYLLLCMCRSVHPYWREVTTFPHHELVSPRFSVGHCQEHVYCVVLYGGWLYFQRLVCCGTLLGRGVVLCSNS
jgi:hypothetical protein